MSFRKFKFVSPGVFVNEIDNTQRPAVPEDVGPVVIGRSERGPGLLPTKVDSFSEFVEIFGNPVAGGQGGDIWRDGNRTAPMYATYAAQAYLRNRSPLTFVRLTGVQDDQASTGTGEAGWKTTNSPNATDSDNGGAYGLFLFNSSSLSLDDDDGTDHSDHRPSITGSLAAIWYVNKGTMELSGTTVQVGVVPGDNSRDAGGDDSEVSGGAAALVVGSGVNGLYTAVIRDENGTLVDKTQFDLSRTSAKYLRKVFNTNPTLMNDTITQAASRKNYFLGETYDQFFNEAQDGDSPNGANFSLGGQTFGVLLALGSGSVSFGDFKGLNSQQARTGWFISQDLTTDASNYDPSNMQKLFKFHTLSLNSGEWEQANLKISIANIKVSTNDSDDYGTFDVLVRRSYDNDQAPQIVERFSNCSLNPNSENYLAKKVGDAYYQWDTDERRYQEYGNYPNQSKFIRVEMDSDVDSAVTDARYLPFGFQGPLQYKDLQLLSNQSLGSLYDADATGSSAISDNIHVLGGDAYLGRSFNNNLIGHAGTGSAEVKLTFPKPRLRFRADEGNSGNPRDAYFGIWSSRSGSVRFDRSYVDFLRIKPDGIDTFAPGAHTKYAFQFSLDDISSSYSSSDTSSNNGAVGVYISGSRASSTSYTSQGTYENVLDAGYDKFTSPLFGGFDGLDITEQDPFRNNFYQSGVTNVNNYAFNSVKRALDSVRDPEVVDMNLLTLPGIHGGDNGAGLTDHLLNICEDRGDALGLIDINSGYVPLHESTSETRGSVSTAITNIKNRGLNTSYGACYYPYVRIKDTIGGSSLFAPPSIVALGTYASAENKTELWFAPAGFKRGGLSEGSAGIPVIGVREKLTSKERDKLYSANINPIASFPSEGIVIFGQKTLQVTPSALDRINVRRLMIYVKREISRMARDILFDQNVEVTWNRFKSKAIPFLQEVKSGLGLANFKFLLDTSTTTPDLQDRNIVYAKVFLKPVRAIEFIAIDFILTDDGAAFDD